MDVFDWCAHAFCIVSFLALTNCFKSWQLIVVKKFKTHILHFFHFTVSILLRPPMCVFFFLNCLNCSVAYFKKAAPWCESISHRALHVWLFFYSTTTTHFIWMFTCKQWKSSISEHKNAFCVNGPSGIRVKDGGLNKCLFKVKLFNLSASFLYCFVCAYMYMYYVRDEKYTRCKLNVQARSPNMFI